MYFVHCHPGLLDRKNALDIVVDHRSLFLGIGAGYDWNSRPDISSEEVSDVTIDIYDVDEQRPCYKNAIRVVSIPCEAPSVKTADRQLLDNSRPRDYTQQQRTETELTNHPMSFLSSRKDTSNEGLFRFKDASI